MQFNPEILRPGDCLLYSPSSFAGWYTAVKTWCRQAVHIEIYIGNGQSLASRNGIGVNRYPLRLSNLSCVRRPLIWANTAPQTLSMDWFNRVALGQKYDLWGQLRFFLISRNPNRNAMWCSEYSTRQYRDWHVEWFNPEVDADTVAPSMFYQAGTAVTVWERSQRL